VGFGEEPLVCIAEGFIKPGREVVRLRYTSHTLARPQQTKANQPGAAGLPKP
jgi:hypothetical protein